MEKFRRLEKHTLQRKPTVLCRTKDSKKKKDQNAEWFGEKVVSLIKSRGSGVLSKGGIKECNMWGYKVLKGGEERVKGGLAL